MAKYPMPAHEGHFWAKQKMSDHEVPEGAISREWEVVQTFDNNDGTFRVFVPGMGDSESPENFFWGPEVKLPKELA